MKRLVLLAAAVALFTVTTVPVAAHDKHTERVEMTQSWVNDEIYVHLYNDDNSGAADFVFHHYKFLVPGGAYEAITPEVRLAPGESFDIAFNTGLAPTESAWFYVKVWFRVEQQNNSAPPAWTYDTAVLFRAPIATHG